MSWEIFKLTNLNIDDTKRFPSTEKYNIRISLFPSPFLPTFFFPFPPNWFIRFNMRHFLWRMMVLKKLKDSHQLLNILNVEDFSCFIYAIFFHSNSCERFLWCFEFNTVRKTWQWVIHHSSVALRACKNPLEGSWLMVLGELEVGWKRVPNYLHSLWAVQKKHKLI